MRQANPVRRKCKTCREWFNPMMTVQPTCMREECQITYAIKFNAKKREAEIRRRKKQKTEYDKAARKGKRDFYRQDLSWQHKQTQPSFNAMRRLEELLWFNERGLEPECISCGKTNMDWCCGHFKTTGAQSRLRYDRKNTYLQCNNYCNRNLSGNIEGNKNTRGYKQGLVERFGDKEAASIIRYCETNTSHVKLNWQELEQMRKDFNSKIRSLEKSNKA